MSRLSKMVRNLSLSKLSNPWVSHASILPLPQTIDSCKLFTCLFSLATICSILCSSLEGCITSPSSSFDSLQRLVLHHRLRPEFLGLWHRASILRGLGDALDSELSHVPYARPTR